MKLHFLLGLGSIVTTSSYVLVDKYVFDDSQPVQNSEATVSKPSLAKLDLGIDLLEGDKVDRVGLRELNISEMAAAYDRGDDPAMLMVTQDGDIVDRPSGISKQLEHRLFRLVEGSFSRVFGRLNIPKGHKDFSDWSKWWAKVKITEEDFLAMSKSIKIEMTQSSREFDLMISDHEDEIQRVLKEHLKLAVGGGREVIANPRTYGKAVDVIWEQFPSPVRMYGREKIGYDAYMEKLRQEMLKQRIY